MNLEDYRKLGVTHFNVIDGYAYAMNNKTIRRRLDYRHRISVISIPNDIYKIGSLCQIGPDLHLNEQKLVVSDGVA